MDTSIVLSRIYVKTSNNQIRSLESLKNAKDTDGSGLLTPMKVQSTAYVSSDLSDNHMAALEGFIYITTEKQSNDYNFKVFDVDKSQMIRPTLLICDPCTMVFLNTNNQMTPGFSSTLSAWLQAPQSTVKMYKDYPKDDVEANFSQFFSNPVESITGPPRFIPHVEKFSISLGAFYIKSTGDFYFAIQPYYDNPEGYTTTGNTTTGLYMKPVYQTPKPYTITCLRDTSFSGTTGANIVGSLQSPDGRVSVRENDDLQHSQGTITPADQIQGWTTNVIGQNITISSENADIGEFYVQYYIVQGQQTSDTFSPTLATSPKFETSTKGSDVASVVAMGLLMILKNFFEIA